MTDRDEAGLVVNTVAAAAFPPALLAVPLAGTLSRRTWALLALVGLALAAGRVVTVGAETAFAAHVQLWADLLAQPDRAADLLTDPGWVAPRLAAMAWGAPLVVGAAGWLTAALGRDPATDVLERPRDRQRKARRAASRPVPDRTRALGRVVDGPDAALGRMTRRGLLRLDLPTTVLRGMAVAGTPGSGKTMGTLLSIADACARAGIRVFVLDPKGDPLLPRMLTAVMLDAGIPPEEIRVFPTERYDAWRGDADSVYSRLAAMLDWGEPYHTSMSLAALSAAVRTDRPPRTGDDLVARLDAVGGSGDYEVARHARDLAARYRGFLSAVSGPMEPDERGAVRRLGSRVQGGWAYDDARAGLLALPGLGRGEDTAAAGRLLLADFADYAARRKPPGERAVLIVDEFGMLDFPDAQRLVEQVRGFGCGMVMAAQHHSGFGVGRTAADRTSSADAVVASCAGGVVLHRMAAAAEFARLASTAEEVNRVYGVADERVTGSGAAWIRRTWGLDPADVQRLDDGMAFVVHRGDHALIRVRRPQPSADALARADAVLSRDDQPDTPPVPESATVPVPYLEDD